MSGELSFGVWLQRRRLAMNMTQRALGNKVGCTAAMIRKLEADERRPGPELLRFMAQTLQIAEHEWPVFLRFARGDSSLSPAIVATAPAQLDASYGAIHRPGNLPASSNSLFGRQELIMMVRELLQQPDVRLLTLSGPGGVGKTRLALAVATSLRDHFADGAFFVDLAPITDPNLVISAIASILGVKEEGPMPLTASLIDYVRDKELLLVLDNFEQVLDAGARVGDLLRKAPELKVMVTSRAILGIYGEHNVGVLPLTVPLDIDNEPLEQLAALPAVSLFINRAEAANAYFSVSASGVRAVAEICKRLDGLPLAIELAAARCRLLTPEALLSRLDRRLPLLTQGARDAQSRHQTLRNLLDWSYDLLEASQQSLFARIAVFVGGCSLEQAEEVCEVEGSPLLAVLDGVEGLLSKSLLRQEHGFNDQPRITMLETIREYALEQLDASGDTELLRRRHAHYFLRLAEDAEIKLQGPQQEVWLCRLDEEHDNLRAALAWSQHSGEHELGQRIVAALFLFWVIRGHVREGRAWLDGFPKPADDSFPTLARAKALACAGFLACQQGDYVVARGLHKECLALSKLLGAEAEMAASLHGLGDEALSIEFDYARAVAYYTESLHLYRKLGDDWGIADVLHSLGSVARYQGQYAEAEQLHRESLRLREKLGDTHGIAWSHNNLGWVAYDQGRYDEARVLHERCLSRWRQLRERHNTAAALSNLGRTLRFLGDYCGARERLVESLQVFSDLNNRGAVAYLLEGLAGLEAVERRGREAALRAARLLGAASTLRKEIHADLRRYDKADYRRNYFVARAQVDRHDWRRAWAEGCDMTEKVAVAYALSAGKS